MKKYILLIIILLSVSIYFIYTNKNIDENFLKTETNFSGNRISAIKENVILLVDSECSSCIFEIQRIYKNKKLFNQYNILISSKKNNLIKKICKENNIDINQFTFIENENINNYLNSGLSITYPSTFKIKNNKFIKTEKL